MLDQDPTDDGPHGEGDEEAQEHERRVELGVALLGGTGEQRDVDQGCDEGPPDQQADHERPPGRSRHQGAARHQRVVGPAQVEHERDQGERGAGQEPRTLGGEDRHLGIGRGERQDDAAEGDRQVGGSRQVGLGEAAAPRAHVEQRPPREHAAQPQDQERPRGDQPHRPPPATAAGHHRDEELAVGEVGVEPGGGRTVSNAAPAAATSATAPRTSGRPASRPPTSQGGRSRPVRTRCRRRRRTRTTAQSAIPAAALMAKMPRQVVNDRTAAPKSGPSTAADS